MKKMIITAIYICILGSFSGISAEELSQSEHARMFYSENNIEKALNILTKIPETDRTAQDWLLIGNILQDENKTSEAVFMFKRAIIVDKEFYKPYYNLGNIYLNEERCNMAIDNYKAVIKIKKDFPYAYYNIGCAYIKLGNFKQAKKYLEKAVELKNTEADFQYNLAFVYKKLNKPKLAQQHLLFYNKLK